jgi:hypothetical protein
MNDSCKDIRFTFVNSSGEYSIPYFIESGCNSENTKIWIRVPKISVGNTTIFMYYGNPNAESKSNESSLFENYETSETCSGSTAGGKCTMTFNSPSGYEFYSGSIDLEAAGDMGYGGEYEDETSCYADENYERFNVTVENECYGTYSPGVDGCSLNHILTWPKSVDSLIKDKTSFSVVTQVTSKVNSDPGGCGFYYYFRVNLTSKLRKSGSVDHVYEGIEEARVRNGYAKTININPVGTITWNKLCEDVNLNGKKISVEIYDENNSMLLNCTDEILSNGCCDINSLSTKPIYVKTSLFTNEGLISPEILHINITWNSSAKVTFRSLNQSFEQRNDTYAKIFDKNWNLIAEGYTPLSFYPKLYETYTYKSLTPVSNGLESTIYNLNITKSEMTIEEQIVDNYTGYLPEEINSITPIYALNDSDLSFEKAQLIIPKNGVKVD